VNHGGIECRESDVIACALRHFSTKKVDYMDCFLAAVANSRGIPVASFDRDFRKFDDIEWRCVETASHRA
jgi:predicted nucleic acid-binding protein